MKTLVLSEHTYYAVAGQPGRACDDTQVLLTGNTALRFGMLCDTQSALRLPYARSFSVHALQTTLPFSLWSYSIALQKVYT